MHLREGNWGWMPDWLPQTPAAAGETDLESRKDLPAISGKGHPAVSRNSLEFPRDLWVLCNQGVQEASWCVGDPQL